MKCVAIISSPFQLFSFNELINQKNINNYFLFVLVYNHYELLQIKNLALLFEIKIHETIIGRKVFQYFLLKKLIRKLRNPEIIVIGNFFSDPHLFFLNEINNGKIIVLDDGLNSKLIVNSLDKKNYPFFKNIFIRLFRLNLDFPKRFSIFTIFDLNSNNHNVIIEKNQLNDFKKNIKNFKKENIILLIGQPFVELKILDEFFYFSIINKINRKFPNLIYIPSRKENDRNLYKMKKQYGINILRTNINIEHYILNKKIIPKSIIGFTSTALVSLNKLFNQEKVITDIKSVRISERSINKNRSKFGRNYSFEEYYRLLEDIEIMHLKDV